ncbi:NAD(P)-dependent oxidoreductase [Planktomarina temperata]|nr:NAD(P)-dependent oxidoreductase [Planktomarina temperata]MDB2459790.1 NAD(P)-dependent oxidoreductase [Planktomarina temperata]
MRILITGGNGFVGHNLAQAYHKQGVEVLIIDNLSAKFERSRIPGVEYRIKDTGMLEEDDFEGISHVVHLGEYARVEQSLENFEEVMKSNRNNFWKVISYCSRFGLKLIYSASSTLFADAGKAQYYSPYTLSKKQNVELLNSFAKWYGLNYAICYFNNVYGPGEIDEGENATVVGKFIKLKSDGAEFAPVSSPGTQRRCFTHIEDTVSALQLIIRKGQGDGYQIGVDEPVSILELASLLDMKVTLQESSIANRMNSSVDNSKVRSLGWKPKMSLRKYLSKQK